MLLLKSAILTRKRTFWCTGRAVSWGQRQVARPPHSLRPISLIPGQFRWDTPLLAEGSMVTPGRAIEAVGQTIVLMLEGKDN